VLALLYDVHGNLPALEAVLADARGEGAGRFVIGGDVALFGAWPAETVARLRQLEGAAWIRGNGERWTAGPPEALDGEPAAGGAAACRAALGDEVVAQLAGLPESLREGDILYVHASPVSDVRSFLPEPSDDEGELLEGLPAGIRRLVFGHTHLPFLRQARPRPELQLVNPGSVGLPLDGDPRAAYALAHDDGRIEHRRVAYGYEDSAAALIERFGAAPWTEIVAGRLRAAGLSSPGA
jgi:diadenosine tetraphosphatase ApaH/serine/threonine PP2A family protein phosphatase